MHKGLGQFCHEALGKGSHSRPCCCVSSISGRSSYRLEGSSRSQMSNFPEGLLHLSITHFKADSAECLKGAGQRLVLAHTKVTSLVWQLIEFLPVAAACSLCALVSPVRGHPAAWLWLGWHPSAADVLGISKQSGQGEGSHRGTVSSHPGVCSVRGWRAQHQVKTAQPGCLCPTGWQPGQIYPGLSLTRPLRVLVPFGKGEGDWVP